MKDGSIKMVVAKRPASNVAGAGKGRGVAFDRVALTLIGKLLVESEPILDSFLQSVRQIQPDLLLIPGDLTKDGEVLNHQLLADKLNALEL